jgi:hypothetical protein
MGKWFDADGMLHRDNDLPAVVEGKYEQWYCHGRLHRDGDLPAEVNPYYKLWWKHGLCHRDGDLPAVVSQHSSPAMVLGSGYKEWWVDGVRQTPEDRAQTRRWSALRAAFVGAVVAKPCARGAAGVSILAPCVCHGGEGFCAACKNN